MIKWKGLLVIVLSIVLALGISFGADFIHLINQEDEVILLKKEAIDFCADNIYLGDRYAEGQGVPSKAYDIKKVLSLDDSYDITVKEGYEDVAEIALSNDKSIISIKKYDKLVLTVSKDDEFKDYEFLTIDGVNCLSVEDFYKLAKPSSKTKNRKIISYTVILQNDIILADLIDTNNYFFKKSFYGNGHTVYCDNYQNEDAKKKNFEWTRFTFYGKEFTIRDTLFVGKYFKKNEMINLDELKDLGIPIFIRPKEAKDPCKVNISNCVFENFARGMRIQGADVHIKGCLFQNFAVCGISLYTFPKSVCGPSNLVLENSVIANALSTGICNWCPRNGVENDNNCTIEIKGFTDFYCWKQTENAKIVSENESYAKLANNMFQQVLKGKGGEKYFYNYNNNQYINMGIVIVSINKDTPNKTQVVGYAEQNLNNLNILDIFPETNILFSTLNIYGYVNESPILPGKSISDNPYIYFEMKNGR